MWCSRVLDVQQELAHAGAHTFFGVGGPVFAVEADEDRGVGNGHGCLQDEDVEFLAGFVDLADDAFVRDGLDLVVGEEALDLAAVVGCSGGVIVGDEGEFGVHVNERSNMDGAVDGAEDESEDVEVRSVGFDGFDAGRGLERVGGVDNEDPVAVSEERHLPCDAGLPIGLCGD